MHVRLTDLNTLKSNFEKLEFDIPSDEEKVAVADKKKREEAAKERLEKIEYNNKRSL